MPPPMGKMSIWEPKLIRGPFLHLFHLSALMKKGRFRRLPPPHGAGKRSYGILSQGQGMLTCKSSSLHTEKIGRLVRYSTDNKKSEPTFPGASLNAHSAHSAHFLVPIVGLE